MGLFSPGERRTVEFRGKAMIELLKKELRGLLPSAVVIAIIYAGLYLHFLSTEFPDLPSPEVEEIQQPERKVGTLIFSCLFSVIVGANLLIGERNAGTLRFLDALPTTRTRVFFSKMAAAFLVLVLDPVLALASAQEFPRQIVLSFCLLSLTLVLSFSGIWFPMAAGFLFWGFFWLRTQQFKWLGLFDPSEFLSAPGFLWGHAAALMGAGTVFFILAWLGFLALGERLEHSIERMGRLRSAPILRLACFFLTPVAWLGLIFHVYRVTPHSPEKPEGIGAYEQSFASEQTRRYHVVFREPQRQEAREIIAAADAVHDRVTGFLRADSMPAPIVLDLATPVDPHAAGVTNWTKIRLPLRPGESFGFLKAALGHETTHAYINHLSEGAMHRHFQSTRFFHEGLATLLEHRLFSTPAEQRTMRRVAAFAHSRGKIPFATLANNDALSSTRDKNLVYPLGELFCEALVAAHGEEAPGAVLRAVARMKVSHDLKGIELWRRALHSCGLDLERVLAGYDEALEAVAREEAEFVSRFPKSSAIVEIVGGDIVLRRSPSEVASAWPVFQLQEEDGVTPPFSIQADGSIRIPRSGHTKPRLRYLLGWESEDARLPLFEPWAETDLSAITPQ
jgi:hypothetical protein